MGQLFGPQYTETAHEITSVFAMIETMEAVENLSEILSVEGIDVIYIGPSDLALSMGHHPARGCDHADVAGMIGFIRNEALRAGKGVAIHCSSAAMVQKSLTEGFGLASLSTDLAIYRAALAGELAAARSFSSSISKAGSY